MTLGGARQALKFVEIGGLGERGLVGMNADGGVDPGVVLGEGMAQSSVRPGPSPLPMASMVVTPALGAREDLFAIGGERLPSRWAWESVNMRRYSLFAIRVYL